jgi:fibronectin type 3 domain-containing protein
MQENQNVLIVKFVIKVIRKMKNIVISILYLFVACFAQAQNEAYAKGTAQGNFIFCGDILPKSFSYLIQRKTESKWDTLAILSFPNSKEAFLADALQYKATMYNAISMDENTIIGVWKKLSRSNTLDSAYAYAINNALICATGNGFMDATAKANVKYDYRISQMQNGKIKEEKVFKAISFPGTKCQAKLIPYSIQLIDQIVNVDFHLVEGGNMAGCKVYRSYYLRSNYEPIEALVTYRKEGLKNLVSIRDENAIARVAYSYKILPFDNLGNPGDMSEAINLYNVEPKTIQASVNGLKSKSLTKDKAIEISWNAIKTNDLTSIEIFKSDKYDGNYEKVMSIMPNQTKYVDKNVEPIRTYYYTLVLNGKFETSIPSARVSGMLEASEENLLAPQNVNAGKVASKVVVLSWNRVEMDTRGYYVYRSFNTELPEKYSDFILSDSNSLVFYDTIKSNEAGYYSYAIVDVNTSYKISPLSEIVKVTMDADDLPLVSNFKVGKINDQVLVIWDNMRLKNNQITAYNLYKQQIADDGKVIQDWKKINTEPIPYDKNLYIDNDIKVGVSNFYSIETIGLSEENIGDRSNPIVFTESSEWPLSPMNIQIYQTGSEVNLNWNAPLDENVSKIKIYRALKNEAPKLLTRIAVNETKYNDKSVKKGNTYFYFVVSESKAGLESKNPEALGVSIN